MDHLDWFSPNSSDVDEEVGEFYRVLAPGGGVSSCGALRRGSRGMAKRALVVSLLTNCV
jgi:hypothetical protein